MEKWGLGYEDVLSRRVSRPDPLPRLRLRRRRSAGRAAGLRCDPAGDDRAHERQRRCRPPARCGWARPIVDMGTGLYSAIGILMALHERGRSGHGQYLDMTLYDCGLALLHPQAANYFLNGKRPMPAPATRIPNLVPYDKYPDADLRDLYRQRQQRAIPQAVRHDRAARARGRSALRQQRRAQRKPRGADAWRWRRPSPSRTARNCRCG